MAESSPRQHLQVIYEIMYEKVILDCIKICFEKFAPVVFQILYVDILMMRVALNANTALLFTFLTQKSLNVF